MFKKIFKTDLLMFLMEKQRGNKIVFSLIALLLILLISAIIYLEVSIINLKQELDSTKTELELKINLNFDQTQQQLDEVGSNLIRTQEDIGKQINELKATTSADFSGIIEDVVESVVSIRTDVSQGSGFIIHEEGFIVTNVHVLTGAKFAQAVTSDGEIKSASLIGYDAGFDVAILKISGSYKALEFDDSDNIRIGEKVIAVGNPLGLSFSVTEGIVSALNRDGLDNEESYIQTDVPLNPGNSGGPLINKKGKVIGINNFKVGGAEGLGFALESNVVVEKINEIAFEKIEMGLV